MICYNEHYKIFHGQISLLYVIKDNIIVYAFKKVKVKHKLVFTKCKPSMYRDSCGIV